MARASHRDRSPPSKRLEQETDMEAFKQRCKQIVTKFYVFVRAAGAAVVLGMLETFGSPRGRRLLAVGALIGSALLFVLRPPVRVVAPGEVGVRINRLTAGVT